MCRKSPCFLHAGCPSMGQLAFSLKGAGHVSCPLSPYLLRPPSYFLIQSFPLNFIFTFLHSFLLVGQHRSHFLHPFFSAFPLSLTYYPSIPRHLNYFFFISLKYSLSLLSNQTFSFPLFPNFSKTSPCFYHRPTNLP